MSEAILVFDDDCGFCTWWADFFAERSAFRIVGFSDLTDDQRERLPDDYEECSHLLADGETYSCGASLEQAFVRSDLGKGMLPLVRFLRNFEDYTRLRERTYHEIANRRSEFGQVLSKTPPTERKSESD